MDRPSAERVLKFRSGLTSQPYGPTVIDAWHQALNDVTEAETKQAMRALVHDGERDLSVPAIRGWLRDERRRQRNYESSQQGVGLNDSDFAVMQPELVAARGDWWRNGRQGHYPGCPCDACRNRTHLETEP